MSAFIGLFRGFCYLLFWLGCNSVYIIVIAGRGLPSGEMAVHMAAVENVLGGD